MTQDYVIGLGKDAIWTALQIAAPLLGISLAVGLLVSLFQAVTQLNESTLSFVPKVLAVVVALMLFGPWMLNTLVSYSAGVFNSLPALVR
jgi:flagellar biosynthetic protein FliQ